MTVDSSWWRKVDKQQPYRQSIEWLKQHGESMPQGMAAFLAGCVRFCEGVSALAERRKSIYRQLLRALGIIKSSEKDAPCRKEPCPRPPRGSTERIAERADRLRASIGHSKRLQDWHMHHVERHGGLIVTRTDVLAKLTAQLEEIREQAAAQGRSAEVEAQIMALAASVGVVFNGPEPDGPEDPNRPMTPEERETVARLGAEWQARSALGGGADARFAPLAEVLMAGMTATTHYEERTCSVAEDLPRNAEVLSIMKEERRRIDFSFQVTVTFLDVEKAVVQTPTGRKLISASTEDVGPAKKAVTWPFLSTMGVVVALYALPFNRLARMLSTPAKRFTAMELSRHFQAMARHLLPIYVHLGRKLANAPVLSGDDTPSKVLEVAGALEQQAQGDTTPLPWADWGTPERARRTRIAQETARQAARDARDQERRVASGGTSGTRIPPPPSLSVLTAEHFGFASERKDGTRDKVGFNTTVLLGRAEADDPKTTVVFYRSHLGSVGNLLDRILRHRDPAHRHVVVQTDLSTTNLLHPDIARGLDVHQAGCGAHARRPFFLYRHYDPNACDQILHFFKGFSIYEHHLDLVGRNETNTLAVRRVDHRKMWEYIRMACQNLAVRWSKRTELGKAAAYVLRHYDKLTYYLNDARVSWTNNACERMLRTEKLIAKSAYFRKSLEGRCALDIMRTMLQTTIAAKVDPNAYLQWVLRMPEESIASDPASFTPWAYAKDQAEAAETAA